MTIDGLCIAFFENVHPFHIRISVIKVPENMDLEMWWKYNTVREDKFISK